METPGIADILLNAYPAMMRDVAQRAEGIVHAYHGLERELIILADEITMRTANHVPVAADELERWLMRSQNINQRQLRACEDLNQLGGSLNETAMNDGVGVFLRGLFEPTIEHFGAAANAFTAAVTTAATSQRD